MGFDDELGIRLRFILESIR